MPTSELNGGDRAPRIGPPPTSKERLLAAAGAGALACVFLAVHYRFTRSHRGDFGLSIFGAESILRGVSPYPLVGPGKVYDWPFNELLYPATSFVLAIPFTPLSLLAGIAAFTLVSAGVLAFAITKDGWQRLPIFLSHPFFVAAGAAQWSPLLTASLLLPPAGLMFAAKPNVALALLAATDNERLWVAAITGAAVLVPVSLILLPSWPAEWMGMMRRADHATAPILTSGGVLVLLNLLRWRRPEARLLLALACVPQTLSWYEALPVMLAAQTYRENLTLALISWIGFPLQHMWMSFSTEAEYNRNVGSMMIALVYLPATLMILRRPNRGAAPVWWTAAAHLMTRPAQRSS